MPSPNELDEIRTAWTALLPNDGNSGWRSIAIDTNSPLPIRAARKFPGGEPSILVGAHRSSIPSTKHLPNARGFRVELADNVSEESSQTWVAITLVDERDQELFESMILDLLYILSDVASKNRNEVTATQLLIERIQAWQEFMDRTRFGLLSDPEEIGLVGELEFLRMILVHGIDPRTAIESWKGPFGGNQDFLLGSGAVEVKTSISSSGFPAKIGNLDQLDNSLIAPLFLAAARLELAPSGITLGELVNTLFKLLSGIPFAQDQFRLGLLRAGYLESQLESYIRRFNLVQCRLLPVTENFPSLTHRTIPIEIVHASYTIDIDQVEGPVMDLAIVLSQLGAK